MSAIQELEAAVSERGRKDDTGIVMVLKLVERSVTDVERWVDLLGAGPVCASWLEACRQWMQGVSITLSSAYQYDEGPERRIAVELAAEESAMRLLMGLERESREMVAMLKNLDGNAARAASELVTRIELANRVLRIRAGVA